MVQSRDAPRALAVGTYQQLPNGDGNDYDTGIHKLPGPTPLLQMDADRCTKIVIFPRSRHFGGTVDPDQMVEEPLKKARRIFLNPDNPLSHNALERLKYVGEEPISMELYQQDIRARFLEILEASGIEASQFPSIDEDEDFVKVYLPLKGEAIEHLAESLKFQMPFKKEAYESVEEHGPHLGRKPLANADGRVVVAHAPYDRRSKHLFEDFSQMDAIRILRHWFNLWVQMDEMESQGIIKCTFPCPVASQIRELHDTGLHIRNWFNPFFSNLIHPLRAYFGEEITFYFKYAAYLIYSFLPLSGLGLVFFLIRGFMPPSSIDSVKTALACLISIWAACISQMFSRHASRVQQLWNVKEKSKYVQNNPNWDEKGAREICTIVVNLATIAYMCLYIGVVAAILLRQYSAPEDSTFAKFSSLILSLVMKVGNILWTFLAPMLVKLENHRTQSEMEDKLAVMLAAVKLFVGNFPFFSQCFLTNWLEQTCAPNFPRAAKMVWPDYNHTAADDHTRQVLRTFAFFRYKKGERLVCFKGCYPSSWADAEAYTPTNCDVNVRSNLLTFFLLNFGLELVFLVVPLLLSFWEVRKEYWKVQLRHRQAASDDSSSEEEMAPYSFLQWEAKKFKYEFNSWGGDRINDFLDLAISYSVVACWGSICPLLFFMAIVFVSFSLRLRLYRMLYVTRRPSPRASAGLGVWRNIFNAINVFAVGANVGLFTVFFYPMCTYSFGTQLICFIIAEHAVLLLQAGIQFVIPARPADVVSIEYYNKHVKCCHQLTEVGPNARTSLNHIALPLVPEGAQTTSSGSDNDCTDGWC